jgi:hypothetical protein
MYLTSIKPLKENVSQAHDNALTSFEMLVQIEQSYKKHKREYEDAKYNCFFAKVDMIQTHMLATPIHAAPILPREIMQLVLDCACTIRRAATNPDVTYMYVCMRNYDVVSNVKCPRCHCACTMRNSNAKCQCNTSHHPITECHDCLHPVIISKTTAYSACMIKTLNEVEMEIVYTCPKRLCVNCASHEITDKFDAYKCTRSSGTAFNEYNIKNKILFDAIRKDDGKYMLDCCRACWAEINKLL